MKQETKELIDGLKNWYEKFRSEAPLTPFTEWAVGDGDGYADEGASNMDKVIAILDSLERFENQLTHGGFIPDRNGKSCKDGDKIKITRFDGTVEHGKLEFDDYKDCYKFMLMVNENEALYFDEVKSWEKED